MSNSASRPWAILDTPQGTLDWLRDQGYRLRVRDGRLWVRPGSWLPEAVREAIIRHREWLIGYVAGMQELERQHNPIVHCRVLAGDVQETLTRISEHRRADRVTDGLINGIVVCHERLRRLAREFQDRGAIRQLDALADEAYGVRWLAWSNHRVELRQVDRVIARMRTIAWRTRCLDLDHGPDRWIPRQSRVPLFLRDVQGRGSSSRTRHFSSEAGACRTPYIDQRVHDWCAAVSIASG